MIRKLLNLYLQKLWVQVQVPVVAMVIWVSLWAPNQNGLLSYISLLLFVIHCISTIALFVFALRCLLKKQWWAAILRLIIALVVGFLGLFIFVVMSFVKVPSRVSP